MSDLGIYRIGDYLTFAVACHKFSTGARYAPTNLEYRIYQDDGNVSMVSVASIAGVRRYGYYTEKLQLTAVSGFAFDHDYNIHIEGEVDSVIALDTKHFRIIDWPNVNVTSIAGDLVDVTVPQIGVNAISLGGFDATLINTYIADIHTDTETTLDGLLHALDGHLNAASVNLASAIESLHGDMRNKLVIDNDAGDLIMYERDDITEKYNVASAIWDDSVTTTRLRLG